MGIRSAFWQEESFLLQDEFHPPQKEEPFLVVSTDIAPIPNSPGNANPAEAEAETAADEALHEAVLPESQEDTVSLSPCVPRLRLRCKTSAPPDSPFNVKRPLVGVAAQAPDQALEKGDLTWWLGMDEACK